MTRKHFIGLLAAVVAMAILAGCRTAPIHNVKDAPITASETRSMEDIRDAIVLAGNGLGWTMRPLAPGHVEGTLNLRSHMARVDVLYDRSSYDILYKDSSNLDHDGGNIHSNYNGWIQNLSRAIDNQLMVAR